MKNNNLAKYVSSWDKRNLQLYLDCALEEAQLFEVILEMLDIGFNWPVGNIKLNQEQEDYWSAGNQSECTKLIEQSNYTLRDVSRTSSKAPL